MYIYIHTNINVYPNLYIHIHLFAARPVAEDIRGLAIYIYIYINIYVYTYIHVNIYIYTYILYIRMHLYAARPVAEDIRGLASPSDVLRGTVTVFILRSERLATETGRRGQKKIYTL